MMKGKSRILVVTTRKKKSQFIYVFNVSENEHIITSWYSHVGKQRASERDREREREEERERWRERSCTSGWNRKTLSK